MKVFVDQQINISIITNIIKCLSLKSILTNPTIIMNNNNNLVISDIMKKSTINNEDSATQINTSDNIYSKNNGNDTFEVTSEKGKDNNERFQCNECGLTFTSRNKLFKHLKETEEGHTATSCKRSRTESTRNDIELEIATLLEEPNWYTVIKKPQGLATMGQKGLTLRNSDYLMRKEAFNNNLSYKKKVPCHRLDRETGGVMVCSDSKLAERVIMTSFRAKLVRKKYLAIVSGRIEPEIGMIDNPVAGKRAVTKYRVSHCTRSHQYGWISTVELWPITGRRHQLRRHMQLIGHSIIGDRRYAHARDWPSLDGNMFLWAVSIDFPDPRYCQSVLKYPSARQHRPGGEATVGIADSEVIKEATNSGEIVNDNSSDNDDADEEEELINYAIAAMNNPTTTTTTTSINNNSDIETLLYPVDIYDEGNKRVKVSIPEPPYYEQFRQKHEKKWKEKNQS